MISRKIVTPFCTAIALVIMVVLASFGLSMLPMHHASAVQSAEVVQLATYWDKNCSNCTDYIQLNSTVKAGDALVVMILNTLDESVANTVVDTLGSTFSSQVSYCSTNSFGYCGSIFTAIAPANGSDILKVSAISGNPAYLQQLVVFAIEVSGVNVMEQSSTFGWCSGNVNNTGSRIFSLSTGPDPDAFCPILPSGCVGPCSDQTNPAYLKVDEGDFAASLLSDSASNSTTMYRAGSNFTAINFGGQALQYSTSLTNETNFPATVEGTTSAFPAGWIDLAIVLPLCPGVCNTLTSTTTATATNTTTTPTTNTTRNSSTLATSSTSLSSPTSLSSSSSYSSPFAVSTTSMSSNASSSNPQSSALGSPQTILIESMVAVAAVGGSIAVISLVRRKPT